MAITYEYNAHGDARRTDQSGTATCTAPGCGQAITYPNSGLTSRQEAYLVDHSQHDQAPPGRGILGRILG